MKKISWLFLVSLVAPAHSQSLLSSLKDYQSSLPAPSKNTSTSATAAPSKTTVVQAKTSGVCKEDDQTSLPLAYVSALINQKDGALDIIHDSRSGELTVSAEDMISNCSSMLEWKLRDITSDGKKSYALEVKFKKGDECDADNVCKYKVAIVEKGVFQKHETMSFKPTLKGFEECLQKSGVNVNGQMQAGAIYTAPLHEEFQGLKDSGSLLFVSHGPASALTKAKFDKFVSIDGCDHFEKVSAEGRNLLSVADEEKLKLDGEAAKLKSCPISEYSKVADFLEKYENYSSELGDVRDHLILEAAKKSAQAIASGKYTDEDLKVISDFNKYIVEPKVALAKELYNESEELDGDAKKAKQDELKAVLKDLIALNSKPYFVEAHVQKFINDGRFEDAEKLKSVSLTLSNFSQLGSKVDGAIITPEVATVRIAQQKSTFADQLDTEEEKYEIRTGQSSGKADYYTALSKRMRSNIQVRSQNYMQEIQEEYARVQPGGYCYKYFRNTQHCVQDSMERIQELQSELQRYNKVDGERAVEYDAKAKEYGALEAEGRRYIAAQNGEPVPEDKPVVAAPTDTTTPAPRQNSNSPYTFDFNQTGYINPQTQQPPVQQPQVPYGYNMNQMPYNGGFNGGFQGSFGYGYGNQYPTTSQYGGGYWSNPYSAYQYPSMYGPRY